MKKLLLLSLVFGFTPLAWAQQHVPLAVATTGGAPEQEIEHAPTVAQCQADQRLWLSKIEDNVAHGTTDVTYAMLDAWEREMGKCEKIDPPNQWRYFKTQEEAIAAADFRVIHFLTRHNLWSKFLAEDAEGKR